MTVFRAATLRTFFFAFHTGAKELISDNDEKFKKTFSKLWGCSGGWLSGTCPHGVVYVLKFVLRAESPRDYVDVLLSMKFQPNTVFA